MTNGPATPNGCGFGFTMLSEYCVAMAAVSLARGRRVDNGARKSRGSAPCAKIAVEPSTANQTSTKRASPDESCRDLSDECSAIRDRSKVALAVGRIVHLHNRLFGGGRLGAVSPLQPVVVDADCLKLELHRPHDHPDILDYWGGFLRGRCVHGLLCLPFSSQGGKAGRLQSRK